MCKDENFCPQKYFSINVFFVLCLPATLKWKSCDVNSKFSKKALAGGRDSDGAQMFVGRATVYDVTMPAKIIPERRRAYVCEYQTFIPNYCNIITNL